VATARVCTLAIDTATLGSRSHKPTQVRTNTPPATPSYEQRGRQRTVRKFFVIDSNGLTRPALASTPSERHQCFNSARAQKFRVCMHEWRVLNSAAAAVRPWRPLQQQQPTRWHDLANDTVALEMGDSIFERFM